MHVPCSHVHQQGACSTSTRGATGTPHTHASVQPGRRERATIRTPSRPKRVENAWGIGQHGAAVLCLCQFALLLRVCASTRRARAGAGARLRAGGWNTKQMEGNGNPTRPDRANTWCAVRLRLRADRRAVGHVSAAAATGGTDDPPAARTQRQHGTYQHGWIRRRRVDSAVSLSCPVPHRTTAGG